MLESEDASLPEAGGSIAVGHETVALHRRRSRGWWMRRTALFLVGLAIVLAYVTNVPTRLTRSDVAVMENDLGLKNSPRPTTFGDQIRVIRLVQARVFANAPYGKGIPEYEPREPSDLMKYGRGLCYDRSRTLDKALAYMGFETRHVFLLYRAGAPLYEALFRRGWPSHAVTEVKTKRGWLYVDSNKPWIALTRSGQPVGAQEIAKHLAEFDDAPDYVTGRWWAIPGLYSRKGAFYYPYFPLPQLNWHAFLDWLFFEKLKPS